jgi:hypothetical protein
MDCWSLAGSLSLTLEALKRCYALATLSHSATLLYHSILSTHSYLMTGVRPFFLRSTFRILQETPQGPSLQHYIRHYEANTTTALG